MKKSKLVYGVGIMDAGYPIDVRDVWYECDKKKQKVLWVCPFYRKWKNLLQRCYSEKYQERKPTYEGCYVCQEWLTFSNFKSWMEKQDWEGKELDKDILFPGNKVYSPESCVFVEQRVNAFLLERNAARGECMIGVRWRKARGKFEASCSNGSGKSVYLGVFDTEIEAHEAWLSCKLKMAYHLASEQIDPRIAQAIIDRYENYKIN